MKKLVGSLIVVVLLLVGIGGGMYLVSNPQVLRSRAQEAGGGNSVQFATTQQADINNDGQVNLFDFNTLVGDFGKKGVPIGAINVKLYGATGEGTNDDTAAIQAVINKIRSENHQGAPGFGATIYFPPGRYSVDSLDFTKINNLEIIGVSGASFIHGNRQTSSKPVIDLTGSNNIRVVGVSVAGANLDATAPAVLPSVGWLIAPTTLRGDSNANYFEHIGGYGYFQVSQMYFYNTVDNLCVLCRPAQNENGKSSFVITDTNEYNVSSPYVTIDNRPDVTMNMTFVNVGAKGFEIRNAYNINFFGGSIDGQGNFSVKITGNSKHIHFSSTQFTSSTRLNNAGIYLQNGTISGLTLLSPGINNIADPQTPFIKADSDVVLKSPTIQGVLDTDIVAGTQLIHMDESNPSSVRIEGGSVDLGGRDLFVGGSIIKTLLINPGNVIVPSGGTNTSK